MPYQILFVARAPQHLFNFQFIFPVAQTDDDSLAAWRAACDIQPGAVRLAPQPDAPGVVVSWSGGNIAPGATAHADVELYGPNGLSLPVSDSLATAHRLLGGGEVALILQPLFSLRRVGSIRAAPPLIAAAPAGLQSDLDRAA
jgi:hypothetical protein